MLFFRNSSTFWYPQGHVGIGEKSEFCTPYVDSGITRTRGSFLLEGCCLNITFSRLSERVYQTPQIFIRLGVRESQNITTYNIGSSFFFVYACSIVTCYTILLVYKWNVPIFHSSIKPFFNRFLIRNIWYTVYRTVVNF